MSKGSIQFEGLTELQLKLKKNLDKSPVKDVVKRNGAQLQEKAMHNAPVRTGFLKRNIHIAILDSGMTAKITSDASYAPYQEWGTRFMSGTPHVGPAYKSQRPIFVSDMQKFVK